MTIKETLKKLLRIKPKYQGIKRNRFFEFIKPDLILDVGANTGNSALDFFGYGYKNIIYSFEPVSHLFNQLSENAIKNDKWKVLNFAIGDIEGYLEMNISGGHGGSSSFLEMTDEFILIAPDQKVISQESVKIITLNNFYKTHNLEANRIFLKIDVQGYEMQVLKGSLDILDNVIGIKIETSIIKQYKSESDIYELLPFLIEKGFAVFSFEDGWRNPNTNELLQVDIFLFNKSKFC